MHGRDIYHLFTETEGNSVFCGPEIVDVSRGFPMFPNIY